MFTSSSTFSSFFFSTNISAVSSMMLFVSFLFCWNCWLISLQAYAYNIGNQRTQFRSSVLSRLSVSDSQPDSESIFFQTNFFKDLSTQLVNKVDPDVALLTEKLLSKSSQALREKLSGPDNILSNINVDSLVQSFITKSTSLIGNTENMISDSVRSMNLVIPSLAEYHFSKEALWHGLELLAAEPSFLPLFTLVTVVLILAGVGYDDELVGNPYSQSNPRFDAKLANRFYGARPLFVFRRLLKLALLTGGFNTKLLIDWKTGNLEKNEKERAKEALALATKLGPTFIKLGQALSIRTDLITEAYALELRKLQDAVPPFDSDLAKKIICEELQIKSLDEIFKDISAVPIASASIGQVYKATLQDGRTVAVKVQRPKILNDIALDLYLLKLLSPLQTKIINPKADDVDIEIAAGFVDEWGKGLVVEVDYKLEAKNTKDFLQAMQSRGLNAVTAPTVVEELSTSRVIVTQWMDGTRLDIDASPDVPRLCGVAVNAYLTMLLDTGVLHCDPHPGNLLRTTDGKLCILDWGMTLELPKDLQYSLLEFIAHVNSNNFDALPQDFVNLGATPADKIDKVRDAGITDGFAFAMRQLSQGGGPKKIRERVRDEFRTRYGSELSDEELREKARADMLKQMETQLEKEGISVNGVNNVIEKMSKRNRELFRLPTFMLYTTRAFSTLEGIGLSIDENYSIIQECYPYLAKRLMTDNSPRSRAALRDMLVSSTATGGLLSTDKLLEFSSGFTEYTASTAAANSQAGMQVAQEAFTDLLLDPQGNLMQELLVDSIANVTDSLIREGVERAKVSRIGRLYKNILKAPSNLVHAVVPKPLQVFTLPLTLPYDITKAVYSLAKKDVNDQASIDSAVRVWNTVSPRVVDSLRSSLNNTAAVIESGDTALARPDVVVSRGRVAVEELRQALTDSKVIERLPTAVRLGRQLGSSLLHRVADRLESRSAHFNSARDRHDSYGDEDDVGRPNLSIAISSGTNSKVLMDSDDLVNEEQRVLRSRIASIVIPAAQSAAAFLNSTSSSLRQPTSLDT